MPSVLETKLALISQQSKNSNCHDKLHQWHISAEEDSEKNKHTSKKLKEKGFTFSV